MFFNRKNKTNDMFNDLRFSNPDFTNQYHNSFTPNNMYNNFEENRLLYEIKENRRRINNLAKRIIRLENYLRIRDTSDYSILDDDK